MRFRRRRSLLPRVGRRPSPEDAAPLKGQLWTRSERNLRAPDVHPIRRIIAAAVATGECALLGWLWLGPAASAGTLVDIQGPAGADPKSGAQALDPALLTALVNIQRGFPALIGQEVAGFIVDSCGDLTLISKKGWRVYFGRVLTPEEFTTLRDKLSALKAISGHGNVDYNSTDLSYVNVMNPAEPAAGYKSRTPATPSPSPGAPQPSPSPVPTCK